MCVVAALIAYRDASARRGRRPAGASGPALPGPQLLLEDGLVDQHAESIDGPASALRRGSQERRLERVVHEIADDLGRTQEAGSNGTSLVPMPMDVALTTMSACATSSISPTRAHGASVAAAAARSPVRLTTAMSAAPARPNASTRLRAAAPAPTTTTPALDGDAGGRQRSNESAAVGAVADERGAVTDDGVDRLQRRRSRRQRADGRCHLCLQRRRHGQPDQPERAHRRRLRRRIRPARRRRRSPNRGRQRRRPPGAEPARVNARPVIR